MAFWQNIPDSMVAAYAPVWWRYFRRVRDNQRQTAYRPFGALQGMTDTRTMSFAINPVYTTIHTINLYVPDCYVGTLGTFFQISIHLSASVGSPANFGEDVRWRLQCNGQYGTVAGAAFPAGGTSVTATPDPYSLTATITGISPNTVVSLTVEAGAQSDAGTGNVDVTTNFTGPSNIMRRAD